MHTGGFNIRPIQTDYSDEQNKFGKSTSVDKAFPNSILSSVQSTNLFNPKGLNSSVTQKTILSFNKQSTRYSGGESDNNSFIKIHNGNIPSKNKSRFLLSIKSKRVQRNQLNVLNSA